MLSDLVMQPDMGSTRQQRQKEKKHGHSATLLLQSQYQNYRSLVMSLISMPVYACAAYCDIQTLYELQQLVRKKMKQIY